MKYEVTSAATPASEIWDERSVKRLSGGFDVVLVAGLASLGWLKKGTPLAITFADRKATPIKTAKLTANATNTATTYSVAKGHTFEVGDFFGTPAKAVTITAIDKATNTTHDVITVDVTIGAAYTTGQVMASGSAAGVAKMVTGDVIALNYADVKIDSATGKFHCSGVFEAHEVKKSKLPYELTTEIIAGLTDRFLLIP